MLCIEEETKEVHTTDSVAPQKQLPLVQARYDLDLIDRNMLEESQAAASRSLTAPPPVVAPAVATAATQTGLASMQSPEVATVATQTEVANTKKSPDRESDLQGETLAEPQGP